MEDSPWKWWQARRGRYNLALAAAGIAAYALTIGISLAFGHWLWRDVRGAAGVTLFLGVGFLILMGAANVAFLLGPGLEAALKPRDTESYRETAWRMGFWGSVALPFAFPLVNLANLIGAG